jgi:hypothetical protein
MALAMVFPFDEDAKLFLFIEAQIKSGRAFTRQEGMSKQLAAEMRTLILMALICYEG